MRGPDPITSLKQQAARALVPLLEDCNREDAGALICVEPARIADLRRGKLDRFSLERLIRFLLHARAHVELRITPPAAARHDQRR